MHRSYNEYKPYTFRDLEKCSMTIDQGSIISASEVYNDDNSYTVVIMTDYNKTYETRLTRSELSNLRNIIKINRTKLGL